MNLRINSMTDIEAARSFAEVMLVERERHAAPDKLANLRQRAAAVRSGLLDNAPEVEAALLAVRHFRSEQDQAARDLADEQFWWRRA